MKITFVRPHLTDRRSNDAMEPLAFAVLAALTPGAVELALIDERLEPVPDRIDADVVAITVETYTARRAYQIAASCRANGSLVVLGGYHATFFPDEALNFADAVVIGDAEEVWPEVLRDAAKGRLQKLYHGKKQPPLEGLRFDRSIFAGKRYQKLMPVQYGRGCRFACDFCSIHAMYGTQTRQRPTAEVVAEIAAIRSRRILFVDDNLFVNSAKARELFTALVPLKIKWACQASIDIALDGPLLDLMAASGCFAMLIGFESLNEENLRSMKKRWNLRGQDYASAISKIHERGIQILASFVFGYEHDTPSTFEATIEFALRTKVALANFNTLTPMIGSAFHDRLVSEQRLLFGRWWLDPAYRYGQATFRPMRMSPEELTEACNRARTEFYSLRAIARRIGHTAYSCGSLPRALVFLAANLINRREFSYKLGHRLGADIELIPHLEHQPVLGTLRGAGRAAVLG